MSKSKQIDIVMRFNINSEFEQGIREIKFGKYKIIPIPYKKYYLQRPEESEGLLAFKSSELASNPNEIGHVYEEANMILSWLSLIFWSNIKVNSMRVNNINVALLPFRSSKEKFIKLPEDFIDLFNKLNSLDKDTLSRYLRSCNFYNDAIDLIETNKMMSYILFVTSIECLARNNSINAFQFLAAKIENNTIDIKRLEELKNKYYSKYGRARNFVEFIKKYFSRIDEIDDMAKFEKLLSNVYSIRSRYLHEGKDFAKQLMIVDRLGIKYFVNYKNRGKKIVTPGLFWFAEIVQDVLLSFIREQEIKRNKGFINELAKEALKLKIKLSRPIKKGDDIKLNDIKLEL